MGKFDVVTLDLKLQKS